MTIFSKNRRWLTSFNTLNASPAAAVAVRCVLVLILTFPGCQPRVEEVCTELVDILRLVTKHLTGEVLQSALQTGRDRDPVEERPGAQQQTSPTPTLRRGRQANIRPDPG